MIELHAIERSLQITQIFKAGGRHKLDMSKQSESLLKILGERVRSLRARRGMTRKGLSADSSVSERYLAQLELGKGNISVGLLNQIAEALQVNLSELLRSGGEQSAEQVLINELISELAEEQQQEALQLLYERFSTPDRARRRIALMGLRGAGKSTLGRMLSQHYDIPFVQLVSEVEHLAGMGVSEIFSLSGQAGYRRMEEKALIESLRRHESCVIETGGSIVSEPKLLNLLLTSCFVLWVKASPEEHMSRVVEQGDLRPMQQNEDAMSDLRRILQERQPYYSKAHAALDTSNKDKQESFLELLSLIPKGELIEADFTASG